MYLTQKNIENEGGRTFALSLYLADNDSEDNWREATQEEYYEWQRKMEEQAEAALSSDHGGEAVVADAGGSPDGGGKEGAA